MLNGPIENRVPITFKMPGICARPTLAPPEYSSPIAVKMLSVPRVTMNGGRLSRVTRTPLRNPAAVPTAMPISRARKPGTPFSAASLAITNIDRIEIAPTARSMPAVRMISV